MASPHDQLDESMKASRAENKVSPVIFTSADRKEGVTKLWKLGLPPGDKTGWPSLDKHYTVVPGQLTVITGWPSAGKSEFLDALLVNLARQGWRVMIFSPENKPTEIHIAKLLEKISGKPFGHGPTQRLTQDEVVEYGDSIAQWFGFMEAPSECALTAAEVIEAAQPFLSRFETGTKRGLVIDPWNELEHTRPQWMSQTEYISYTLTMIRNWARRNEIHVWIVAHPAKMRREEGKLPVPKPDMISDSQHWWNKADCCLTVWREADSLQTQIHIQKIRFKHVGQTGIVDLRYDRITGRYSEPLPDLRDYKLATRGD